MQASKPKLTFWFLLEAARHPAVWLNKHCLISWGKSCPPNKRSQKADRSPTEAGRKQRSQASRRVFVCVVTQSTTDPAPEKDVTDAALRSEGCTIPHITVLQMGNFHTKDSAWLVQALPKECGWVTSSAKAYLNHMTILSPWNTFSELFFSLFCWDEDQFSL